ncbi:MAG: two-component system LytT family response regulator [Glaciecola sp.]|jgi:two-component system LytT family response regulator|uniref:LytR/AlgR family response regulator transcription factor n=1 Tax=Congregibacter sp. TaxID=2744308 RepID=UPI0039E3CC55
MSTLSAIIVDDEHLARRGLSVRLQQLPEVDVIAECGNGIEALHAVAQHSPDLLFLDIQMPGMDGFEVVENLQGDDMPMVIFVTAYNEYAVDAFKVHAIDYVLKPIEDDRLHEAVQRAVAHRQQEASTSGKEKLVKLLMSMTGESAAGVEAMVEGTGANGDSWPEKITVKDGSDIQFIRVPDIEWVDAAGDYMCIHATGKTHIMRITMKQLEGMLNPAVFLRVHRSTIVNNRCVTGAQTLTNGEYLLNLEGGTQLKVSRSYKDRIREFLVS